MAYFNELPNLQVLSRLKDKSSNEDYVTIKNLWRRPKLREDIANVVTAFYYYQIEGDERPDQIAEKIYGDPELDWVVLITNNITNLNEDWPLDNNSFYKYLIDKYGSEEEIYKIHHTETIEQRDQFNRLVVPGGLRVDTDFFIPSEFDTTLTDGEYILDAFPAPDNQTIVSVNLIQILDINQNKSGATAYPITDIQVEFSNLKVYKRDDTILNIIVNNSIASAWPSGWGGTLKVFKRNNEVLDVNIRDQLSEEKIIIPERLYEVVGEFIDGTIKPVFKFRYSPGGA